MPDNLGNGGGTASVDAGVNDALRCTPAGPIAGMFGQCDVVARSDNGKHAKLHLRFQLAQK
jgi:hypothetical protein